MVELLPRNRHEVQSCLWPQLPFLEPRCDNRLVFESSFTRYSDRIVETNAFAAAAVPFLTENPKALRVFAEGLVVLAVADYSDFLRHLVAMGVHKHEDRARAYLVRLSGAHGSDISKSGRPELTQALWARLSFKNDARRIEALFDALFECSPWPSEEVKETILDFVLVRNFIIHSGSVDVAIPGGHARYLSQLRRADVFNVQSIGDATIWRLNHVKAVAFLKNAFAAIAHQTRYLRSKLIPT